MKILNYRLLVGKENDPYRYVLQKRKYWITFFNFGWETLMQTPNLDELKLMLKKEFN